jgi:hypothetical protein
MNLYILWQCSIQGYFAMKLFSISLFASMLKDAGKTGRYVKGAGFEAFTVV